METATTATTTTTQEQSSSSLFTEISTQTLNLLSSLATHPLFSVLAAAYVLGLLYLPRHLLSLLLSLLLSPVPVSTLVLLATLLHFGSARPEPPNARRRDSGPEEDRPSVAGPDTDPKSGAAVGLSQSHNPIHPDHFVKWARRGPLEVIYEEYEGEREEEEVEDGGDSPEYSRSTEYGRHLGVVEGLGSLGLCCYTDSDSESDSGCGESSPAWDSPENLCFRWEVEEEGMIEIQLEEENLIEIDISACQ